MDEKGRRVYIYIYPIIFLFIFCLTNFNGCWCSKWCNEPGAIQKAAFESTALVVASAR